MSNLISKAELARRAGVSRGAITKAISRGQLSAAVEGKQMNLDHPILIEWLASKGYTVESPVPVAVEPVKIPKPAVKPKPRPTTKKKTPPKSEPSPAPVETPKTPNPAPITVGGYDIEGLENMSLREIVMRYGSIDGFKRYVDSLKSISDFNLRDMKMKAHRGELVQRDLIVGTMVPLIDVAYQRLVSDVPSSIIQQLIARIESGGDDVIIDGEKIIRDAISRVLKNTKNSIMKMEILKDAN